MSYARWGCDGSDVYVYGTEYEHDGTLVGRLVCMSCTLEADGMSFTCASNYDMVAHLLEHREKGHSVPEDALERLREESAKEFDRDARDGVDGNEKEG